MINDQGFRFDILTIFPNLLVSPLQEGIIHRAIRDGKAEIVIHNIRDFATDRHAMTDDRPFGGGEGMVMKPEPIAAALAHVHHLQPGGYVVLLSPQGRQFSQAVAQDMASKRQVILICGRYEGIDERIRTYFIDDEISIGDYILTGGELAALVIVDATIRLLPGVLGCEDSAALDTFSRGLLKHPQYTRPRVFGSLEVPEELLTGDHAAIEEYRFIASVRQTLAKRPDLLEYVNFNRNELKLLRKHGLLDQVNKVRTGKSGHAA